MCLALWLGEIVPPFVPTLVLSVATPLALGPEWPATRVFGWTADPVLALFFGGFVLGEAAAIHGIDRMFTGGALRASRGDGRALVALVALVTAALSMWMSNIAAAALVIASIRPLRDLDERLRQALLVAIALGANLGGMATPIGTGPNAIAIAAMPAEHPIPFLAWMAFALPLTIFALAGAILLVLAIHRVEPGPVTIAVPEPEPGQRRPRLVGLLAVITIIAWLAEPLHGVPAPVVSLALAAVLFGSGLVPAERIRSIDWSTLILIAGGIALGRLFETSGLLAAAATVLPDGEGPPILLVGALVATSAVLSAVMSNTGTAALLMPVAVAFAHESVALPILVALGSSFGMPFVMSTPPNAMVVGAGARPRALLVPGLVLLVAGWAALTFTGPFVLRAFGYH